MNVSIWIGVIPCNMMIIQHLIMQIHTGHIPLNKYLHRIKMKCQPQLWDMSWDWYWSTRNPTASLLQFSYLLTHMHLLLTYLIWLINDWYKPYSYQDWLHLLHIMEYHLPLSTSLLITFWLADKSLLFIYINPRITAVFLSLNLGNLTLFGLLSYFALKPVSDPGSAYRTKNS